MVLALIATTLSLGFGAASSTAAAAPTTSTGPNDAIRGFDATADADSVITGLVYDQDGRLLDNIQVEAFSSEDPGADPVASDLTYEYEDTASHGAYQLHVPAGEYLVRFSSPDFAHQEIYETAYYGGGAGAPVTVAADDTVALDDVELALDSGAPVTGTVLDPDGHPLAGAYVDLVRTFADGDHRYMDEAMTDGAGHYTFAGVNRGRAYTAVAYYYSEDDGALYLPATYLGQQPVAELAHTFTLPTGSAGTTLDAITLHRSTFVSGHVTGPTGTPVSNADINLYAVGPDGALYYADYTETEGDGSFTASALPGFTYTVGALGHDDNNETYLGGANDPTNAQTFVLGDAGRDVGTIQLGVTGSLVKVAVADGDGDPNDEYDVRVWRKKGDTFVRLGWMSSTATGSYQRRLDWGHQYTFEVETHDLADNEVGYFLGGATDIDHAQLVTPTEASPTLDAGTITLPGTVPGKLRGTVQTAGEPLADAEVTLWGRYTGCDAVDEEDCWDWLRGTTTGAAGGYQFRVQPWMTRDYSSFTVSAERDDLGYERGFAGGVGEIAGASTYDAPAAGTSTTVETITLTTAPGTVLGTVVPEGAAFDGEADVELYCRFGDGDDGYWDWVDSVWTETGQYALRADRAYDACLVSVRYYDYGDDDRWVGATVPGEWPTTDVTSAEGVFPVAFGGPATTAPDVTVVRQVTGAVTGTISTVDGQPLDGELYVRLYRWDSGSWDSWDSEYLESGDGFTYSFGDVDPGTYAVRVTYYPDSGDDSPYVVTWSGTGGEPSGPDASGTVTIGSTGTPQTLDVVLAHLGPITGRVVDADGQAVAGARVVVYDYWQDFLGKATTDADGTYSVLIDEPDYGEITVAASKPSSGYAPTYLGGGSTLDEADYVTFSDAGTAVDDITLSLRPNTLVVNLSTEDGKSLDGTSTSLSLLRWNSDDGYFDSVDWPTIDGDDSLVLTGLEPGTYALGASNSPYDGDPRYIQTWYGAGGQPSSADDTDRVFTIGGADPTTIGIELQRGVALSGTVSTGAGAAKHAVGQVQVSVYGMSHGSWVGGYATTDDAGRYVLRLPVDTDVSQIMTSRSGFAAVNDYADGAPLIQMAGGDRTHDISLTPEWGRIGSVAGVQDTGCLLHQGWEAALGDRKFWVPFDGEILPADSYSDHGLSSDNSSPELAPLTTGEWSSYGPTWGTTATGALCLQWGAGSSDGAVYQALLTPTEGGGYDVVYNYDAIPDSAASGSTLAGYADGLRSFGERVVLPGSGTGYADTADTGLVHHSLGSDVEGRYAFHFDGFEPRGEAPYGGYTRIKGTRGIGGTLTGVVSPWYDSETEEAFAPEDVTVHYRWRRGDVTLGTDPTYVVKDSDFGKYVRLDVEAQVDGHAIGYRWKRIRITQGTTAATSATAPSLSPASPAIGSTITLDPGEWTPGDGLVADDLSYEYRWFRGGIRQWGVDGLTYDTTDADSGHEITATVVVSAPGHGPVTLTTDPVTVALRPQLAPTVAPSITGVARVGETLTVDPGAWGDADAAYSYQWYVGYKQKGTGTTYTVAASDRGQLVTVTVTANAPGFRSGTSSATVGPVVAAAAQVGTLTVHVVDDDTSAPIEGAYVYPCDATTWDCLPGGYTNASGDYAGLATGSTAYHLYVYPAGTYRSAEPVFTTPASGSSTATVRLTKPTPPPANVTIPTQNGTYDGVPVVYWQEDQQFNVSGCAATASPTYTVTFSDGTPARTGALVQQGPVVGGIVTFHATIPAFYPSHGDIVIDTNVPADCAPGTQPTKISVYIDPSGVVTDQYGRTIAGATVTLLRSDNAGGPFVAVPNGSDIMSPANRTNPDATDATGFFQWDVSDGWYRVKAEATGCTTATTDAMDVPPARVELLVKLQCAGATAPSATPAINGLGKVGSTLTTDPGIWADDLDDVDVQWLRDGDPIPGAQAATYQLTGADNGHSVSVRQTAQRTTFTQEAGHGAPVTFTSVSATSAVVGVSNVDPAPTVSVPGSLSGSGKVGSTLTATAPTWSNGAATTVHWYVDNVLAGSIAGSTYQPTAADLGKAIKVSFTGTKAGFADGSATTTPIVVVLGDAPTASTAPRITGTPAIGRTLSADPGTWTGSGVTFGYQWKRAGAAIAGATSATYLASAGDVGKALTVTVTAVRAGHQDGSATSAPITVAKRVAAVTLKVPKSATSSKPAKVTGAVAVAGVAGPLGTVTLYDGKKKVAVVTLKAKAKGKVAFTLKKLKPGKHVLKLVYSGSADTAGATSKAATMTVTKAKKGKKRELLVALRLPRLF